MAKDMTLRDAAALAALAAMIKVVASGKHVPRAVREWTPSSGSRPNMGRAMAADAYELADALLIERERGE